MATAARRCSATSPCSRAARSSPRSWARSSTDASSPTWAARGAWSSNKDNTTIVEGHGDAKEIQARIAQIRAQIEETTSDYDREKLQERLAKLSGGVAVIRVGAPAEVEMKNRKSRVEDALAATRAAAEEGIVPGGGVAYLQRRCRDREAQARGDEQRRGADIVRAGAGGADSPDLARTPGSTARSRRDVRRETRRRTTATTRCASEYCDVLERGIIDPAKVARAAVENAASTAAMILTTETLVTDLPQHEHPAGDHHHH